MLITIRKSNGSKTSIESTDIKEVFICENPNEGLEDGDIKQEWPLAVIYTHRTSYRLNGERARAFIYWHDNQARDLMAIYQAKGSFETCDYCVRWPCVCAKVDNEEEIPY